MELLKIVGDHFKTKYDTDGKLVELKLPNLKELRRIKIERILDNPDVLEVVKARCASAQGVNLGILPWIYDTYVPKEATPSPSGA